MSTDPLSSQMPAYSPFSYGFCNPLRFTDPTGMAPDDIIDINKATGAISITKAAGADIVRLVDNGSVAASYTYGSSGSFSSDFIVDNSGGGTTLTTAQIVPGTADKAQAFFEFAAQSDVEFGKLDVKAPSGENISVVTTSHESDMTSTLPGLVKDYSKRGFTGVKQSHSHPASITNYNESVPTGYYDYKSGNPSSLMPDLITEGKPYGDAGNAIQVRGLKGFGNIKFEVYAPGNNTRTTYDGVKRAEIHKR